MRESFRQGGKVKTCTLANISDWPAAKIEALRRVLRGEGLDTPGAALPHVRADRAETDGFEIERALPHGHVAAVLGMVRTLGLERLLPQRPDRLANCFVAERCWDRVRWAIREYAWRFDGYSRPPREGGTI